MKKTVFLLLIPGCIIAAISCKKENTKKNVADEMQRSLSVISASDAVTSSTKFGVLVNGSSGDDKITIAKKMGVGYVRDAIVLESYNGKAPMLDKYQSEGFKVLLNLNNQHVNQGGQKNPNPYPTNMTSYKKSLENVLDKYKPEVAVIENEPANDGRYAGPIENYFTQLRTAIDVCKDRGIKIADGALHTGMVTILVYQDYVKQGQQQRADDFADRALSSTYLRAAQGKGSSEINAKLEKCKKMIKAYKSMELDYVNFHWYEPLGENDDPNISAPGVAKEVADFLRKTTGKAVLTNEFGQSNQSITLITTMVDEFKLADLSYAIVFSGSGSGGLEPMPLHQGTKLLPNGRAYRDAVAD